MTPDRIVALIGIVMALILVAANGNLRRIKLSSRLGMAALWAVIILAAALAFAGFRN